MDFLRLCCLHAAEYSHSHELETDDQRASMGALDGRRKPTVDPLKSRGYPYRKGRHDAEIVNGSWRAKFNGLRSYVERLPGRDGRLPFADMMVTAHNSYVADELSVLMRVA